MANNLLSQSFRTYDTFGRWQDALNVPPVLTSAPTASMGSPLGTLTVVPATNTAYVITSGGAGNANWLALAVSGGTPSFASITTTVGPNSLAGVTTLVGGATTPANLVTTGGGAIQSATTITAGTGITSTTGAITATAGAVVAGTVLEAAGDLGAPPAAGITAISNLNVVVGAGTNVIKSTTAGANNSAGYLKCYFGGAIVWVPYFANGAV